MRNLLVTALVWFMVLSAPCYADKPAALSLEECYRLAVAQSEVLKLREEDVRLAEARYQEALSALYPKVDLSASQRIRNSNSGSNGSFDNGTSNNGGFNNQGKHPFETNLGVRQPIFTGFRDYYIAKATEIEIDALRLEKGRSDQLLYQDVADVFEQVVYYTNDLAILKKTEKILQQRIVDLREFIKLGKSRDGEIAAAEADMAGVGSTAARVNGLLDASKEMLAFLIGRESNSIKLSAGNASPPVPALNELISTSQKRLDIQAVEQRIESSKLEITAAEREHWPTVSLEGNYYPYEHPDRDRDWDVFLEMSVPLFDGGGIDARIEQSRSKNRSLQISGQQAKRETERDVRRLYSDMQASKNEVSRLKNLVSASRKSYDAQRRDYELGVVTNLDVLAAIRVVRDAERQLLSAETSLKTTTVKLLVAAGGLP